MYSARLLFGPLRAIRRLVQNLYAAGGLLLVLGLGVAVLGLWALAELSEEVLQGETLRMDEAALRALARYASPARDLLALEITSLGSGTAALAITVIVSALLALLGRRHYALLLGSAVAGAWILSPILKALFDRDRPRIVEWRTPYVGQASYPSGHAMMGMVLYITLAFILHRLGGRRWVSAVAITIAGLLIILIGTSRVYLGVHYPSDVLAGFAVGFSWAMFCAAIAETISAREGT